LEILISSFVDHEKNLNDLIVKLEKTVEKISEIAENIPKAKEARSKKDIIFIRVKADISHEEQKKIQEVLSQ